MTSYSNTTATNNRNIRMCIKQTNKKNKNIKNTHLEISFALSRSSFWELPAFAVLTYMYEVNNAPTIKMRQFTSSLLHNFLGRKSFKN